MVTERDVQPHPDGWQQHCCQQISNLSLVEDGKGVSYDLILVGSSFASSFFLHKYLGRARASARVLVLERGELREHRWQVTHLAELARQAAASYNGERSAKPWVFRLAFGGSSNCWWACTPRFLPEDFRLRSTYGVGRDWPLSYDDLEEYYCEAEEIMAVSGSDDDSPYPRSRPYPQRPHRFSDPDHLFKRRFPDAFFNQPTARPTRALPSGRPRCCANGACSQCPIDSKFTILNGLMELYRADPRVTLVTGATVRRLEVANDRVTAVHYERGGAEHEVRGDLVGLGANALFNPFLLLRSGLEDGAAGQGLVEQVSRNVIVDLHGVDNFQGSTSITGLGYMLYSGNHRRDRAAALMESWNVPLLRDERGKWRQRIRLKFIYEDLPQPVNRVVLGPDDTKPEVEYGACSSYAQQGLNGLERSLSRVLDALPVERYEIVQPATATSEGHNLGTTSMGDDPMTSVVDRHLIHHRVRNLIVLGGSVFPTISPSNPTLTICALSLRAAEQLMAPSRVA
jgi:choline dehydrogenase-like flavoprotein